MKRKLFSKTKELFTAVALAMAILLSVGCGKKQEWPTQNSAGYAFSLLVSPDPPSVGLNSFKVKVRDSTGKPVNKATVNIRYSMPAMAGMPAMGNETAAKPIGDGLYEAKIDLGSGGKFPWDIKIEVAKGKTILGVTQWQITPGTKGIKFAHSSGGSGKSGAAAGMKSGMPGMARDQKNVRTIEIPLYQQQLIGVQKDTVKMENVFKTIRTFGRVTYNESRLTSVNLKFSGWIEKLHVTYVGQQVKRGEPLFDIYSPALVATQEEFLQTRKRILRSKTLSGATKNKRGKNC